MIILSVIIFILFLESENVFFIYVIFLNFGFLLKFRSSECFNVVSCFLLNVDFVLDKSENNKLEDNKSDIYKSEIDKFLKSNSDSILYK